jgi:hypothetical protein
MQAFKAQALQIDVWAFAVDAVSHHARAAAGQSPTTVAVA